MLEGGQRGLLLGGVGAANMIDIVHDYKVIVLSRIPVDSIALQMIKCKLVLR